MAIWRWTGSIEGGAAGVGLMSGTGSPNGVVTAPVGMLFLRTDGGAGTTLYVKEVGAGNTGWNPAGSGGGGGGTPGGSDKQIQINESGTFGADSTLSYDYTAHTLNVGPSQTALDPTTVPQIRLSGASPVLVHTSATWGAAGIAYIDNPTETQEIGNYSAGLAVSRFYSPSGNVINSHMYGAVVAVATDPNNTNSMVSADVRGMNITTILGTAGLWETDCVGLYVSIYPAVNAAATFNTLGAVVGIDVDCPIAFNSNNAIYELENHIGIRIKSMSFTGFNSSTGSIFNSYGISIGNAQGGAGVGIATRAAIHISGQTSSNAGQIFGILEDSATEQNVLGSILLGGTAGPLISTGTSSPEGVVNSKAGGLFLRTDANSIANLYIKSTVSETTGWLALGTPYTIYGFTGDNGLPPNANQKLIRHVISGNITAVTFGVGLSGSNVGCLNAPTSNFTMTIVKNGVTEGTMTIGAGQTTGTFSFASPVATVTGDLWDFIAPSSTDPTIAGIYFSVVGARS